MVAAMLVAVFAGMLLQIAITIEKPDGSTAEVVIPDGASAVVDAEGNIKVQLAGKEIGKISHENVKPEKDSDWDLIAKYGWDREPPIQSPAEPIQQEKDERYDPQTPDVLEEGGVRVDSVTLQFHMQQDGSTSVRAPTDKEFAKTARKGDLVDIITSPIMFGPKYFPQRLVASRIEIEKVHGEKRFTNVGNNRGVPMPSMAEVKIDDATYKRIGEVVSQLVRETGSRALAIVPHDVENTLKNDRYQLQGVWSGRLPNDVPFALAFSNNRIIFFAPDGFQEVAKFKVEPAKRQEKSRRLRVIASDDNSAFARRWDSAHYWFEETDSMAASKLFVTFNGVNGLVIELQRTELASNDVELNAIKFVNALNIEPIRLSVHVADPIPDGVGAKIDLTKLTYHPKPVFTNRDIASVKMVDGVNSNLNIQLSKAAGEKMNLVSTVHLGSHLAVVLDGKVVTAPKIAAPMRYNLVIEGGFTREQLDLIANELVPFSQLDRLAKSESNLKQIMLGAIWL